MKRSLKIFSTAIMTLFLISCTLIPAFATGFDNEELINEALENYSKVDEQLREEGFYDDYYYYNEFGSDTSNTTSSLDDQITDYEDYYNSVYESQVSDLREQYEQDYAEFEENKAEIDSHFAENESIYNEAESYIAEQQENVDDMQNAATGIFAVFGSAIVIWFIIIFLILILNIVAIIIEIVYIFKNAPKCDMTKLWALVPLISPLFGLFAVIYVRSSCKKAEVSTSGVTGKITCPKCSGVHPRGTVVCNICGTELNQGE